MVGVLALLVVNYVGGLAMCWVFWEDLFAPILFLARREESPENSLEIREKIRDLPYREILITLFGGLFAICAYMLGKGLIRLVSNALEVKRRYFKAKRGHGVKNDLEDHSSEVFTEDAEEAFEDCSDEVLTGSV